MQLSKIIIGQLAIILVVIGLFYFISDGISSYSATPPSGYEDSFNRINSTFAELSTTINQTNDELGDIDTSGGILGSVTDFIGYFFNSGYKAAKVAALSYKGVNEMVDVSIGQMGLGSYGGLLKGVLLAMILVVFAIGILLNFIIKSGRE
jgi:hypothetical protein